MIMYVVIVIACVLPVVLFVRAASSKSRQVIGSLKKLAGKLPARHDVWLSRGMAFDEATRRLFYVNHDTTAAIAETIPADSIMSCQVMVNGKNVPDSKKTLDMADVQEIELQVLTSGGAGVYQLRFFVLEIDGPFQANFHFQLARKWKKWLGELKGKKVA